MNQQPADFPMTSDELEAAFGARWGIWVSDTGRWWATRRAALTSAELAAGATPFLRAADPAQLAVLIEAQEKSPVEQAVTEGRDGLNLRAPDDPDGSGTGPGSVPPDHVNNLSAIRAAADDDQELTSLQQEFPQFQIVREIIGDRIRFVSRRQEPAARPHTVICAHLAELAAVLRNAPGQQTAPERDSATRRPPGDIQAVRRD